MMVEDILQRFGQSGLSKVYAVESLFACLSGLFVSLIWNKIQTTMVKNYTKFEVAESVFVSSFYMYFYFYWNPLFFFVVDISYYCIVACFLTKTSQTCRNYLFLDPASKTNADTNAEFVKNLAMILGFSVSLIFPSVNFKIAIILFLISDLCKTISKIYTYTKWSNYLAPAWKK